MYVCMHACMPRDQRWLLLGPAPISVYFLYYYYDQGYRLTGPRPSSFFDHRARCVYGVSQNGSFLPSVSASGRILSIRPSSSCGNPKPICTNELLWIMNVRLFFLMHTLIWLFSQSRTWRVRRDDIFHICEGFDQKKKNREPENTIEK